MDTKDVNQETFSPFMASGFYFCVAASILFSYPVAAVFSPAGSAPSLLYWVMFSIVLFGITFGFTAYAENRPIRRINYRIIIVFFIALVSVLSLIFPSVKENVFWVAIFSMFTFGLPLLLPGLALAYHMKICESIQENVKDENE